MDRNGKFVINFQFDRSSSFKDGLALFYPHYTLARGFSEGLAAVKLNDRWGYINKTGKSFGTIQIDHGV